METIRPFPQLRLQRLNACDLNPQGKYVLYWMTAFRRPNWNFALQRAADWARQLRLPLLVFEGLRCDYRWASDRLHQFVIEGMIDNQIQFEGAKVGYFAYLEPSPGAGRGLLKHLSDQAAVVVADHFPCFFLPNMVRAAASKLAVRLEAVDANGLLPVQATDRVFGVAHSFRRFLQKELPTHLLDMPDDDPLTSSLMPFSELPPGTTEKWPSQLPRYYADDASRLGELPIDHDVRPAPLRGGWMAAQRQLETFIDARLTRYADARNHPDDDVSSGLSPYLHFGHVSAHDVFHRVMQHDGWSPTRIAAKPNGRREGWWGATAAVESFLDELITWREIGFNRCTHRDDSAEFDSLPSWSRETLENHARDLREFTYSLDEFEQSRTHDALWNAAQNQLVREGRMHNYLRMLWGKKILHWTPTPHQALEIMIHLNNKYALDGRDPNSYSGIFWVLGRYDRAWGPEREVFGKVRYMSSDSARKKLRLRNYLKQFA